MGAPPEPPVAASPPLLLAVEERPSGPPDHLLWLRLGGVVLLAGGCAAAIVEFITPRPDPWGELASVAVPALGVVLALWPRPPGWILAAAGLFLVAGGAGYGRGWAPLAWPALGIGLGCAASWGRSQARWALWTAVALAAALYVAAAAAGVARVAQGQGMLWILCQGLGSLALGRILQVSGANPPTPVMRRLAIALLAAGVVLPYAALFAALLSQIA